MSTSSTTVRVSVQTRDRLAAQARKRGISISTLLAELAARVDREAIFSAERDATRADLASATVRQEERDWADAANDGFN
ncbi:MAG: antitoxin [Mycobacterium sp.]|nr:antitoxin [Mycobacterium sp.]